jgi:hypothetical protein
MSPGTIVSAHNVLSTVPVSERYLSTCYMPTSGVLPSQVTFRIFVGGMKVYDGPGSPATPTCTRLPFPQQLENGGEVRVQALRDGVVLAEDVYHHQDIGALERTLQTVEGTASSFDSQKLFFLVLVAAAVWFFLLRGGDKKDEDNFDFLRRIKVR